MKTLNKNLKARFTTENDNGKNNGQKMETISTYKVIDKKTEHEIILIRVYIGRSRNAETVKASVWIDGIKENKRPSDWSQWGSISGHGSAGGWGYCKESTAVCDAFASAGVQFFGSLSSYMDKKPDMKKQVYFGGYGTSFIKTACLAVANAAGYNDVVFVEA